MSDDPIGETKFSYKSHIIKIAIFRPQKKWSDGEEFFCKFEIKGQGFQHMDEVIGFDSMHSIILALSTIDYFLNNNDYLDADLIEWPGGELYFPSFG